MIRYEDNPIIGFYKNDAEMPLSLCPVKTEELETSCVYKPIHLFDSLGRRIYRHSLSFLFCYATYLSIPKRNIRIGHSLGDGFYFSFTDGGRVYREDVDKIVSTMQSLVSEKLPIEYEVLSYPDAITVFKTQGMFSTAALVEYNNAPEISVYRINNYYDTAFEPLVPNTSVLSLFEVKKYGDYGFLLRYPTSSDILRISRFKDNPNLFKVFEKYKFLGKLLKVSSASDLNKLIYENEMDRYIRQCEAVQRRELTVVAEDIVKNHKNAVFISGPSSSGKTTFSIKLCELLQILGYKPVKISLDNYYKKREEVPLDKDGNKDFECLEALHLDEFKKNMSAIYGGEAVSFPIWDFTTQERTYTEKVMLEENTIFIIEGIHALNPAVYGIINEECIYKIYISALTQLNLDDHNRISTTDNRILRRILRDHRTRGTSAVRTLEMWDSVERGERKYIFPYQNEADFNFNSATDYELSVLAPLVIPLLKVIKPCTGKSYTVARRLLAFLDNFFMVSERLVPSDSILREFIGGSDYGAV